MLEFGSPFTQNRLFIPPIQVGKYVIPTTAVRTSSSVPYIFMTGTPGSLIIIEQAVIIKQAGTAYGLGASTIFRIWYENTIELTSWNTAGYFDVNTINLVFMVFSNSTYIAPSDGMIGSGFRIIMSGGDMVGGDGDLHLYLQYRVWPFSTNLS